MTGSGGLRWLAWLIAGPTLWVVTFSAAYGVHGLGCELGWPGSYVGPLSLQRAAILLVGALGLLAGLALLVRLRSERSPEAGLPRLGAWIGLVATVFTLAPTLFASSC